MANKIKTRWNCLPGCKTANVMYKTIDRKSAKFLLVLKRRDWRKMMYSLVTVWWRHTAVDWQIEKITGNVKGKTPGPHIMEHLLCNCPALTRLRFATHLGSPRYYTLKELSLVRPQCLLKFASSAVILHWLLLMNFVTELHLVSKGPKLLYVWLISLPD